MVASRYPILAALFSPFKNKKPFSWQMLISYGVVVVKLDLGHRGTGRRRQIGFLANLHLMAFQGKEDQVGYYDLEIHLTTERGTSVAGLVDCVDFKLRVVCIKRSLLPSPMVQELEFLTHQPCNRASATLCTWSSSQVE